MTKRVLRHSHVSSAQCGHIVAFLLAALSACSGESGANAAVPDAVEVNVPRSS